MTAGPDRNISCLLWGEHTALRYQTNHPSGIMLWTTVTAIFPDNERDGQNVSAR